MAKEAADANATKLEAERGAQALLYAHDEMYGLRSGTLTIKSQIMHDRSDRALLMHTNPQESHIVG
jgi:hypothetical protein